MSLAQLWGSGPVFAVVCGRCGCGFKRRIPMVTNPVAVCPCGQANRLAGLVVSS